MSNTIVTIGREFGSGGRVIGEKLAAKLGISFYDKELIELAAEKSGIHPDVLKGADEVATNPFSSPFTNPTVDQGTLNDRLFKYEQDIIREIAAKESCVIVGRCADYILRDQPNCIRAFIYADMQYKIHLIRERHHLKDPELIEKIIRRTDKNRRTYYQYYTDKKWGARENMDLMINSSLLGIDGSVELLAAAVRLKTESSAE